MLTSKQLCFALWHRTLVSMVLFLWSSIGKQWRNSSKQHLLINFIWHVFFYLPPLSLSKALSFLMAVRAWQWVITWQGAAEYSTFYYLKAWRILHRPWSFVQYVDSTRKWRQRSILWGRGHLPLPASLFVRFFLLSQALRGVFSGDSHLLLHSRR